MQIYDDNNSNADSTMNLNNNLYNDLYNMVVYMGNLCFVILYEKHNHTFISRKYTCQTRSKKATHHSANY